MPLNVVHGVGFRKMVEKLNPQYELPSRKIMTQKILPKMLGDLKDTEICPALQLADFCALTTDCWSSIACTSYIGITVHFLSTDWEYHRFVLENSELAVSHTAENLGEAIKECTDHWRITKKVSCTTVDNASNIHKCMDTVLAWPYLHCFAHTLNLAVKAGLCIERIHQVVSRCSRLVAFFRRSSNAAYKLLDKLKALGCPTHALVQDVATRWNSTFDMLERVYEQRAPICAALVEENRMELLPRDDDFTVVESLLEVLKPFKHITEVMSGEKYTTVSSVKPLLHHLLNVALDIEAKDSAAIKAMKQAMTANLGERYSSPQSDELLGIACFLDPRFKAMPFESHSKRGAIHTAERAQLVKLLAVDIADQPSEQPVAEAEEPTPAKKKKSASLETPFWLESSRWPKMRQNFQMTWLRKSYCDTYRKSPWS